VVVLVCHRFTGVRARHPSSPPSATSTSHRLPLLDKLCPSALLGLTFSLSVRAPTEWSNPAARRSAKSTTTLCCLSSRVAASVSARPGSYDPGSPACRARSTSTARSPSSRGRARAAELAHQVGAAELAGRARRRACAILRIGRIQRLIRARSRPQRGAAYPRASLRSLRPLSPRRYVAGDPVRPPDVDSVQVTRAMLRRARRRGIAARRRRPLKLDARVSERLRRYTRPGFVPGVHHPSSRVASSGMHEIQRSEYTERFATDFELERCFLHCRMITRWGSPSHFPASVPAHELARHASMTLSGDGSVQRAISPANPRVTRSFPS